MIEAEAERICETPETSKIVSYLYAARTLHAAISTRELNAVVCLRVRELQENPSAGTIAREISSPQLRRRGAAKALGPPACRPRPDPGSTGRGHGRFARRRQRASARLQGERSRLAGDPHRPRGGLTGRGAARPRAAGGRGTGPVEDCASRSASPSTSHRRRSRSRGSLLRRSLGAGEEGAELEKE